MWSVNNNNNVQSLEINTKIILWFPQKKSNNAKKLHYTSGFVIALDCTCCLQWPAEIMDIEMKTALRNTTIQPATHPPTSHPVDLSSENVIWELQFRCAICNMFMPLWCVFSMERNNIVTTFFSKTIVYYVSCKPNKQRAFKLHNSGTIIVPSIHFHFPFIRCALAT